MVEMLIRTPTRYYSAAYEITDLGLSIGRLYRSSEFRSPMKTQMNAALGSSYRPIASEAHCVRTSPATTNTTNRSAPDDWTDLTSGSHSGTFQFDYGEMPSIVEPCDYESAKAML